MENNEQETIEESGEETIEEPIEISIEEPIEEPGEESIEDPVEEEFSEKRSAIKKYRHRFTLEAQALTPNQFEILAITAGEANGWHFEPDILAQSLNLWDGVHCFIDHATESRSIRDIAGVVRKPTWDEQTQGIRAELHAFGPAANLLTDLGRQILSEPADVPAVRVGFSADILFNGKDRRIEKILKVYSVDLVFNPARGGVFLRALNQIQLSIQDQGENTMQPIIDPEPTLDQEAAPTEVAVNNAVETQLQQLHTIRKQMSAWMLESGLAAAKLPNPISEQIRKQFQDRTFDPTELQIAIQEARKMLSELNAAGQVQGPGRIQSVFDSSDRLQAAVDDLFNIPREEKLKGLEVPRLTGIRELYLSLTGDQELHGGYHPERVQLATTADFSGLVKNALNKLVVDSWQELGRAGYDWWEDITVQEHFNTLHDITGTLIGTVGDLPSISEGAEYTQLPVGDSHETASFTKYGGYIPLTLELIDRDQTRKLKIYARELASAGMRKISKLVAEIFTSNSGVGPTMADSGALFNDTAVTTSGGHGNLTTTALSTTQWDIVCQAVYAQPMLVKNEAGSTGIGPMIAVNPKFVLVPRILQKTAMEICTGALVREQNYVYDNVLKGSAVPVVVPEWSDANDWAAVCDPRILPAIFVGDRFGLMPEIFVAGDNLSPAVFMNDEHRLKVRHYLAVWVNDYRPLHKANVA